MFGTLDDRATFFRKRIRANLMFWSKDQVDTIEAVELPDLEWPNLVRAIQFGLDVPEARSEAGWLAISHFDVMERRAGWREWARVLERAVRATPVDRVLQCRLRDHLGQCLRLDGRYRTALEQSQAAEDLALTTGDARLVARTRANISEAHRCLRQYDEAERIGGLALATLRAQPDQRRGLLSILNTLGQVAAAVGRYDQAESQLREGVDLAEALGHPLYVVRLLYNLANALAAAGRADEALACFDRALERLPTSGPTLLDRTNIGLSKGTLFFQLGDLARAEAVFRRLDPDALRAAGFWSHAAFVANNLGNVLQAQGHFEAAEASLRDAVALLRDLEDPVELANALGVVGEVVAAQGRRAEAEPCWREAIALLEPYPADVRAQRLLAGARRNLAAGART